MFDDILGGVSSFVGGIGGALGGFDMQNALGMRNNYQTALDPGQQRALAEAIMRSQQNLQSIYGNQSNLGTMMMNQAQGGGPNPAQVMLNNATNKNISQNAGQIANVKGINPALAARMQIQNAGMMNQQAAGQGALMGAQQQLNAQNSLASLYGNMGQQQIGGIGAYGGVLNPAQQINASVAQGNQQANQQLTGSLLSAGSSAMMPMAKGGVVPHLNNGGSAGKPMQEGIKNSLSNVLHLNDGGKVPSSRVGKFLEGIFDDVPAMNSGGVVNMKSGGEVPGKANVPGDSLKNDTVPAMLSPDEIVIPRSIILGPNPAKMAAVFVQNELNKKKKGA